MTLEDFIADLESRRAGGEDTPDGGDFGAVGILDFGNGVRRAYRNNCVLEEVAGGVYTLPDASAIEKFRSVPG